MSLLNAFEASKKRKRVELKVEQKWEIIEYRKKFPKLSQVQLIVHFNRTFDTVISKQAMSDILKPETERKRLKSYDDSKMELLENLNDNISEIRDEHKKQKSLFDFFRRK